MRTLVSLLFAQSLLLGLCPVAFAQRASSQVMAEKEAALSEGVLPAWETKAERNRTLGKLPPMITRVDDLILPPPPASPYRAVAEFEPSSSFLVSYEWGSGEIGMLIDMLIQGTVAAGAPAILITEDGVSSTESYITGQGVNLDRVKVLSPPDGLNAKWARDFGPVSLYENSVDAHLAFADLHYYDSRPDDDVIPSYLAGLAGINRYGLEGDDYTPSDDILLYMEGGNYQTDGMGTCILTSDIDEDNAAEGNNQADTQAEVQTILAAYLGCEQIIWLNIMPNNGTGHVDMYAKLLTPTDMLMIDFPTSSGNDVNPRPVPS